MLASSQIKLCWATASNFIYFFYILQFQPLGTSSWIRFLSSSRSIFLSFFAVCVFSPQHGVPLFLFILLSPSSFFCWWFSHKFPFFIGGFLLSHPLTHSLFLFFGAFPCYVPLWSHLPQNAATLCLIHWSADTCWSRCMGGFLGGCEAVRNDW